MIEAFTILYLKYIKIKLMNIKRTVLACVLFVGLSISNLSLGQKVTESIYEGKPVLTSNTKGNKKSLLKAWCEYLENSYHAKTKRRSNKVIADNVVFSDITTSSVNSILYVEESRVEKGIFNVYLYTNSASEKTSSQTYTPEEVLKLSSNLENFLSRYQYNYLSGLLQEDQASLGKSQKSLNKLLIANTKLEKRIERSLRSIAKSQEQVEADKKSIEENKAKVADLQQQINQQRSKILNLEQSRDQKN